MFEMPAHFYTAILVQMLSVQKICIKIKLNFIIKHCIIDIWNMILACQFFKCIQNSLALIPDWHRCFYKHRQQPEPAG